MKIIGIILIVIGGWSLIGGLSILANTKDFRNVNHALPLSIGMILLGIYLICKSSNIIKEADKIKKTEKLISDEV